MQLESALSSVAGSEDEDQEDNDVGLDLARKPWTKEVICLMRSPPPTVSSRTHPDPPPSRRSGCWSSPVICATRRLLPSSSSSWA